MGAHELDQRGRLYRTLVATATELAQPDLLQVSVLIDPLREFIALDDARPDLSAQERFDQLFARRPQVGEALLAWHDLIETVLVPLIDTLHEAATSVEGPGAEQRYRHSMLFIAENMFRAPRERRSERAALIALGMTTLEEALRTFDPTNISPAFDVSDPTERALLVDAFATLEQRARASGVALRVLPRVVAAHLCAQSIASQPLQPDAERLRLVLVDDDPQAFTMWFEMVRRLVANMHIEAPVGTPLHERGYDVLLYQLEREIDGFSDAPPSTITGLLTGSLTLAAALETASN